MIKRVASEHPDIPIQYTKISQGNWEKVTFREFVELMFDFGAGLLSAGIKRGDHIGLIADNRKEWLQADFGLMAIGAVDVPRGCDATERELEFILSVTECKTVITENAAQVRKILKHKAAFPALVRLIVFDPPGEDAVAEAAGAGVEVFTFAQFLEKGRAFRAARPGLVEAEFEKGEGDDLACIIFTSGTTGEPKGVMLTHSNFTFQCAELPARIHLTPGDVGIVALPVWHAFERACEYIITVQGGGIAYSKPIGSILLPDIADMNPFVFPAVPRIFEAVYQGVQRTMKKTGGAVFLLFKFFVAAGNLHSVIDRRLFRKTARFGNDHIVLSWILLGIPWLVLSPIKALGNALVFKKVRAKLGKNFAVGVSGGGALSPDVDAFFWTAGINVVEGYGLTETAPVVSVRFAQAPVFGTVGSPLPGIEARVVDFDGNVLKRGQKGALQVRGPTVMRGYYKRDDLTAKVIDRDGWFDTGDIALLTVNNEIVLRGRIKDTIVLRGGENIEPLPLEMKINESPFIAQSVVVGQDQRSLGVLIVPEKAEVLAYADEHDIGFSSYGELLGNREIRKLFDHEIQNAINAKNGFRLYERISQFALLSEAFEVGKELSAKQEISRYRIAEIYAKEIRGMFKNS
jgi:long-chain acyl-CoA synthetase